MFCTTCGKPAVAGAAYCGGCGTAMSGSSATDMRGAEYAASANNDRETWAAVIGPKNQSYYLDRFEALSRGNGSGGWNWPGALLTFYWLLYRKMWALAVGYFLLPVVWIVLAALLGVVAPALVGLAALAWLVGIFVVPGMFANRWYYKHCKSKIAEAGQGNPPRERFLSRLESTGGTSPAPIIIFLVLLIPMIGILAAVALPAYQDYTLRAKTAQALQYGHQVAAVIADRVEAGAALPQSAAEMADVEAKAGARPPVVRDVNADNGTIDLTVTLGPDRDLHLRLIPHRNERNGIEWECQGPTGRDQRLVPRECRQAAN